MFLLVTNGILDTFPILVHIPNDRQQNIQKTVQVSLSYSSINVMAEWFDASTNDQCLIQLTFDLICFHSTAHSIDLNKMIANI